MFNAYTMSKNPISNQLTPQQETAINLILAGKTDGDVAHAIGKSRSTVNVWRNHDSLFIATLNDRRQQIWGSQLNRLNTLAAEAVDALQAGLHDTDIKVRLLAAVHILKATGVYGAASPGIEGTDPARIATDLETKETERYRKSGPTHISLLGEEEYRSRAGQQADFFAEQREAQISRELEDANSYLKAEADREKIAYWERLLPAYGEISQAQLDALDDDALRQLALDFVAARAVYLKTLKAGLTRIADVDQPVWEDYTKETAQQIDATLERSKAETDTVLQIFIDAWERRGGDTADLLNRSKRKKWARNPMMQPHRFNVSVHRDPPQPALSTSEGSAEREA